MAPGLSLPRLLAAGVRNLPRAPGQLRAMPTLWSARPSRADSLGAWLERNARRHARQPAILFEGASITWGGLNRRCNHLAHELAARGVRGGGVVAVLQGNVPETLAAVGALAKLGAVAALVDPGSPPASRDHAVSAAGAGACLVGEPGDVPGGVVAWDFAELEAAAATRPGWDPPSTRAVQLDDPAFTIGTSGTTGMPKASVMSHMRWLKAATGYGVGILQLGPADVVYLPLPLVHNMGLTVAWGACVRTGAALALRRSFSASAFWDDCRAVGATAFPYIGEVPRYLLAQPPDRRDRDHRVTRIVGVGLRPELWRPFRERFGIHRIYEHYAASEANTAFMNALAVEGTVGFCLTPHALVRYDPETGQPLRDGRGRLTRVRRGEPGLLLARVSDRYRYDGYTDPEATEARLVRDPFGRGATWTNSGDVLRKVGWGHAVFVDRLGDTFRWKSENVSTGQVEGVLGAVAGVDLCAVYGVEVPGQPGRAGAAAVVPGDGFDRDALLAAARRDLPGPAVPVFLRLCEGLQTTGTFKIRKADLRREGVDPSEVRDPLFVALPGEARWSPLDAALLAQIASGSRRL